MNIFNHTDDVSTICTPNNTNTTIFTFPDPPYPPGPTGVLAVMAGLTSLFTTVGNILVVISFIVEKNLRQPSNYLIASLAVTDILIGMFSMPFYSLYLLMKYWPLGQTLCDLWLSMDYTVCLVSQYTVFLITLDRFCSVRVPAKYRNWRTKRKIKIMIAITWLFPAFIFFTSIMGWRAFTGSLPPTDYSCAAEFQSHQLFTVILVISYYWVTLIIMVGLYIGIYQVAWSLHAKSAAKRKKMNQIKRLNNNNRIANSVSKSNEISVANGRKTTNNYSKGSEKKASVKIHEREDTSDFSNDPSSSDNSSCSRRRESNEVSSHSVFRNAQAEGNFEPNPSLSESPLWKPRNSFECDSIQWNVFNGTQSNNVEITEANQLMTCDEDGAIELQEIPIEIQPIKEPEISENKCLSQINRFFTQLRTRDWFKCYSDSEGHRKKSRCENRARKALRTISFILGAFVICWTPYHIVIIIYAYCNDCVNLTFYEFTYWLCYMNSPINPFCYALSNKQFKTAFLKIFRGEYFRGRPFRR